MYEIIVSSNPIEKQAVPLQLSLLNLSVIAATEIRKQFFVLTIVLGRNKMALKLKTCTQNNWAIRKRGSLESVALMSINC